MIESYVPQNSKPGKRLEVAFMPGKEMSGRPFIGVRYDGGAGCEVITERYSSVTEAAEAALDADDGLPLWMPHYWHDQVIACWRIRGTQMYAEGVDFECCANSHIAEGWRAAYYDDVQPLLLRGWPVGEAVYA